MGNCCSRNCFKKNKEKNSDKSKKYEAEPNEEQDTCPTPKNNGADVNYVPTTTDTNKIIPKVEANPDEKRDTAKNDKPIEKRKKKSNDSSDDSSSYERDSSGDSEKFSSQNKGSVVINNISNVRFAAVGKNATYIDQRVYKTDNNKQKKGNTKQTAKQKTGSTKDGDKFLKTKNETGEMRHIDLLKESGESVGMIHFDDDKYGTGFRIGSSYIMTAYHIVRRIIDPGNTGNFNVDRLAGEGVCMVFKYKSKGDLFKENFNPTRFTFEPTLPYSNQDLDTAILKLKENVDFSFPKPIRYFDIIDENKDAYLIGHPDGEPMKYDPKIEIWNPDEKTMLRAQQWSENKYGHNGYEGLNDSRKILFHTSFQHGASGAPAVMLTSHDNVTVVLMLLNGFPSFYYNKFDEDEKKRFRVEQSSFLIEQGVSIKSIWDTMKDKPEYSALSEDIFPTHCFNN